MVTAPIVLFAALTGLLYVFTPQIEAWKYAALDSVVPAGDKQSMDAQLFAAQQGNSGLTVRSIIPAFKKDESTQIFFGQVKTRMAAAHSGSTPTDEHAGHDMKPAAGSSIKSQTSPQVVDAPAPAAAVAGHGFPDGKIVYVNPYTATVLGTLDEMDRFNNWARKLHSTALQGDGWRWVLELGASWLLIMLSTGIYLWLSAPKTPVIRASSASYKFLPRTWPFAKHTVKPTRVAWREWHSFIGLIASGLLLIVLVTGLTWSKYTGANFRDALKAMGQAAPRAPLKLQSTQIGAAERLSAATIYARASAAAPSVRLQLTPPRDASDVWRVANFDRSQPTARVQVMLDQYSGNVLFQAGWDDLPLGAKATGAGIPFHRGEFGLWNQALLIFAALAAIFSVVSGFAMWWQRRPAKTIAAPKITWRHVQAVPWWLWPIAAALGWIMPVFGLSLIAFVTLELLVLWRRSEVFSAV